MTPDRLKLAAAACAVLAAGAGTWSQPTPLWIAAIAAAAGTALNLLATSWGLSK